MPWTRFRDDAKLRTICQICILLCVNKWSKKRSPLNTSRIYPDFVPRLKPFCECDLSDNDPCCFIGFDMMAFWMARIKGKLEAYSRDLETLECPRKKCILKQKNAIQRQNCRLFRSFDHTFSPFVPVTRGEIGEVRHSFLKRRGFITFPPSRPISGRGITRHGFSSNIPHYQISRYHRTKSGN